MTARSWLEWQPQEFDRAGLNRAEREIVATAPQTMFPDLLPGAKRKPGKHAPELDGQGDLFEVTQ